jgi:hypothetical protein
MTEQQRPTPNPQELLQIKDELITRFQQLPAQHQATMALLLVKQVMEGEWGHWMREAIKLRWPEATEPLQQAFPITSVSRADLKETDFTNEEIGQLTDEDMTQIARIMEDDYVETLFWDDLADAIRQVLAEKGQEKPLCRELGLDVEAPRLELETILRQQYPNWEQLAEDERGRLVVMWLNDWLRGEQGEALRQALGLERDEVLPIPPGTPKAINETAAYWYEVRQEAEKFWAKRYDPDAPEDWS